MKKEFFQKHSKYPADPFCTETKTVTTLQKDMELLDWVNIAYSSQRRSLSGNPTQENILSKSH